MPIPTDEATAETHGRCISRFPMTNAKDVPYNDINTPLILMSKVRTFPSKKPYISKTADMMFI
jgi:hypothetical protein